MNHDATDIASMAKHQPENLPQVADEIRYLMHRLESFEGAAVRSIRYW